MQDFRPQDEMRREAAADWVVRLQAHDLDPETALAFDAWLQADPANPRAYDEALTVWRAYGANAAEVLDALPGRAPARRPDRRRVVFAAGALAAAAAAAVVLLPDLASGPRTELYATGKGERRTVALQDGSAIHLAADTRLSVAYGRDGRRVSLDEGQAVFDVARDPRRPFEIAAGDRAVRVVGTEFDVRRRDGLLSVTVAEGAVEVRPADGASGRAYRLHPGQRLQHRQGAAQSRVQVVEASEVMGWRAGRLVYREAPLAEVVADLNREFATPIRIADPELARAPISGVLVLDEQDAVIRRLALLVPLRAVRSGASVTLEREGAPKR